jgi:tRNA nucleotidyltransferase (CCA-adding enzyme)
MRADTIVTLLERCDAFRKPQRFADMLRASECDHRGRTGFAERDFPQAAYLESALAAAQSIDAGTIASETVKRYPEQPQRIPEAVRAARIAAVSTVVDAARRQE